MAAMTPIAFPGKCTCCQHAADQKSKRSPFLADWLKEAGQSRLFLWGTLRRSSWLLRRPLLLERVGATIGYRQLRPHATTARTWTCERSTNGLVKLVEYQGRSVGSSWVVQVPVRLDSGLLLCRFTCSTVLYDELIVSATTHWVASFWAVSLDPLGWLASRFCFFSGVSPTATAPLTLLCCVLIKNYN